MLKILRMFALITIMIGSTAAIRATMIVVIYTNDGFWLGADSYRSSDGKHLEDVCKVHETRYGLLVKAGESQGITYAGIPYSTDREVEELIVNSSDDKTFKNELELRFRSDIEQELAFIDDSPYVTYLNLGELYS